MVRCNNDTDGPNRTIHYSGEFATLPAEKRENQRIESHDLNDKRVLPARKQFEGLESTTRRTKQRGPPECGKTGSRDPLLMKHGGTAGP
jgi:hypothetical protein